MEILQQTKFAFLCSSVVREAVPPADYSNTNIQNSWGLFHTGGPTRSGTRLNISALKVQGVPA